MNAIELFENMWADYTKRLCPSAVTVHDLLEEDTALINDHIALRTFSCTGMGIEVLARPFIEKGYKACGDYVFESKHLTAKHFEHSDQNLPKVFISQLEIEQCSETLQSIVQQLVKQLDTTIFQSDDFLYSGAPWTVSFADYQVLAKESEYAAWLAAHGYGANHFTVNVNQLNRFNEVIEVNQVLREQGFAINESGGEVKGSPQVLLEQSSTMADKVLVRFSDSESLVPGGFYEFAKRYQMSQGGLYQGFVAASADKIFESTDS